MKFHIIAPFRRHTSAQVLIKFLLSVWPGMIRDYCAHVRFFAKAKKISHGLIKSAGGIMGNEISHYSSFYTILVLQSETSQTSSTIPS